MRYAWIDQQVWEVSVVVAVLRDVGQHTGLSSMEAWRYAGANAIDGHAIANADRTVRAEIKGACGSPRMTKEVRDRGRSRVRTDSKQKLPAAPNLSNREFTPAEPNRVCGSFGTGSKLSRPRMQLHNSGPLEGEKPREPHETG